MILALLLVLSQMPGYPPTRERVNRLRVWPASQAAGVPFVLAKSYVTSQPAYPPCTVANSCVMLCTPNAGNTAWQCVDGNGAAFGTVTQGTGSTYRVTQFGLNTMTDVTSASHPYVVSTSLDSIFSADHTIVFGGYGTTATDPTFQHIMSMTDGTRTFYARNEGGSLNCVWSGAGGVRTASFSSMAQNGWSVASCRQSGTDHYSRINGTDSVTAAGSAITVNMTAGTHFDMGDRSTAGLPLRGPMAFVAVYTTASSTQLTSIERTFFGSPTSADVLVSYTAATVPNCYDYDGGAAECFTTGAPIIGQTGMVMSNGRGIRNQWAADNLAAATWTNVSTPTITSNGSAGKFFNVFNANEVDRIEDTSAAAFQGKQSGNAFDSNTNYYTAWCNLAQGTTGVTTTKARFIITTNGTPATTTCDITGLTSTIGTYSCRTSSAVTGATSVTAQILVGNAVTDQGSILVDGCGINYAGWVEPPVLVSSLPGSSSVSVSASSWPAVGGGGKYEVVFTPRYSVVSDWSTTADTLYAMDVNNGVGHSAFTIFGYTTPGRALARTTDSLGASTDIQVDGIDTVPGQRYAASIEWIGSGTTSGCTTVFRFNQCSGPVSSCFATTALGSSFAAACPDSPTNAKIMNRYDSTVPTDATWEAFRVYTR